MITVTQATDIFMNLTKRLQALLASDDLDATVNSLSPARGNKDLQGIGGKKLYGLTEEEIDMMALDLSILDNLWNKWAQEDDSLAGVLKPAITKQKNTDFRLKIDSWRKRKDQRKATKKSNHDHSKALSSEFEKS